MALPGNAAAEDDGWTKAEPSVPRDLAAGLAASRARLLEAVGEDADVTFVRGIGNLGDQLIAAGVRRLLAEREYREIAVDEAGAAEGATALLAGSGAWCSPYHEVMPDLLGVLERRFERVVVLPSSFDLAVPAVRRALAASRALVFAREAESYRQVRDVCRAELAHDTAFFFDYAGYRVRGSGTGTLHAFRTDRESARTEPLPRDNHDVSSACSSLDEWLWTIARHARVETDRAHVMIAAALLGKEVRFDRSATHKLPALFSFGLAELDVKPLRRRRTASATGGAEGIGAGPPVTGPLTRLRERLTRIGEARANDLPSSARSPTGEPRVTVILLSHDRPGFAANALRSLRAVVAIPYRVLLLDNGSAPPEGAELARIAAADPRVELVPLDRNLGCAGGRRRGAALASTEHVVFLDDDAEVFPGAIEHLVHALDADPDALAVGAQVVLPSGAVQHCGGDLVAEGDLLRFRLLGYGLPLEDPGLGSSGPCRWVAGPCVAIRRAALVEHPLDPDMAAYYEDSEWCYRVGAVAQAPFRRAVEALVLHHHRPKEAVSRGNRNLARAMPFVTTIAHFFARHGRILDAILDFAPELATPGGGVNVEAARSFLFLVSAKGPDWVLRHWEAGDLRLVFSGELDVLGEAAKRELAILRASRWWRAVNAYWRVREAADGLRRKVLG
jgi:GT2 family glycosyltransferase